MEELAHVSSLHGEPLKTVFLLRLIFAPELTVDAKKRKKNVCRPW